MFYSMLNLWVCKEHQVSENFRFSGPILDFSKSDFLRKIRSKCKIVSRVSCTLIVSLYNVDTVHRYTQWRRDIFSHSPSDRRCSINDVLLVTFRILYPNRPNNHFFRGSLSFFRAKCKCLHLAYDRDGKREKLTHIKVGQNMTNFLVTKIIVSSKLGLPVIITIGIMICQLKCKKDCILFIWKKITLSLTLTYLEQELKKEIIWKILLELSEV